MAAHGSFRIPTGPLPALSRAWPADRFAELTCGTWDDLTVAIDRLASGSTGTEAPPLDDISDFV
jgi:hypothetical protein